MKAKISILYAEGDSEYVDFTFNPNHVDGYYTTRENVEDGSINILLNGCPCTIKRDPIILKALEEVCK